VSETARNTLFWNQLSLGRKSNKEFYLKMRLKILLFLLVSVVFGGFYYWNDLVSFWEKASIQIGDFERNSIELLASKINKEVSAPPPLRSTKESAQSVLTRAGVIKWTNQQRSANGDLPLLSENKELNAAAMAKAQDMFKNQYFAHESLTGAGPAELANDAGYEYLAIGENLALGNFESDKDLVQAWMDSPGHRANILNGKYSEIGAAVLKGVYEGKITWLAVQEFGLPASACPKVDENLKTRINTNKTLINNISRELDLFKQELDGLRRGDNMALHNQKVAEYNQLVKKYNNLVEETKSLVNSYNIQVRALNACAQ
jgi:uncharacterized protein YkwD